MSRGGTLIQDIRSQVPDAIKHEQGPPRDRPSHRIRLSENTRLSSIAGAVDALVNSIITRRSSRSARIWCRAWSTDGVIEALEDPRPDGLSSLFNGTGAWLAEGSLFPNACSGRL